MFCVVHLDDERPPQGSWWSEERLEALKGSIRANTSPDGIVLWQKVANDLQTQPGPEPEKLTAIEVFNHALYLAGIREGSGISESEEGFESLVSAPEMVAPNLSELVYSDDEAILHEFVQFVTNMHFDWLKLSSMSGRPSYELRERWLKAKQL